MDALLKKKSFALLLFFMGIFFVFPAKAFSPDPPEIQSFLNNNFGLRSQNWAISQQPVTRYMYFASSDGLIEFNGVSMKRHIPKESRPVRSVLAHSNGKIFTGSFEEFGFWQHDQEGNLIYTSLTTLAEPENNDEVWKIYSNGEDVYFQSFTTIYKYDGSNTVERFVAPYTMLFLHRLENEFVVQIIDEGLFWFKNGEYILIEGSQVIADKKVHAIIPYETGKWLICTDADGLFLFDGNDFKYFRSEATNFLKTFNCNAAKQLSDSSFVFGSILNGLIITDKQGNIQQTFNATNGLNNNTILSFFLDADMGLWTGLDEGINYINLLSPLTHYTTKNGTLGTIYAMLKKDDFLYIGTNHGLFRAQIIQKGHIYSFRTPEFLAGSQGQVWTLEEIDDQIICGHNEGTFVVRGNRFQKISSITGGWAYSQMGDYVLGGTYTGIIVLEKSSSGIWSFRNKIENFNEPVRYIETDYLGYIWASHHQKGVFKIELSEDLTSVVESEHITSIDGNNITTKVFKVNNRVVFITGADIYTWDFVRNEIVPFEILNQSIGEYNYSHQISHFRKNQYWFIREDKMALFEINLDFTAQKLMEIVQESVVLPQRKLQLVSIDENILLKPNHQYFDAINLSLAKQPDASSRLAVERLHFYSSRDTLIFFQPKSDIRIPSRIKNLTVFFSDPSAFSMFPQTYQFRIKELDQAWQSTSSNQFTYLDLKHGSYTIEIRREANDVNQIHFLIGKPWYITDVAFIVYAFVFAGFIWGLIIFFRFEINRQKELAAMEIKQSSLEKELDYKSYELLLTMRHLLLKDNILNDLQGQIDALKEQSAKYPVKHIKIMERIIGQGLGTQSVEWENAMNNLKLSQQGFFKALKEKYPQLTTNDMRLCSYLRMNFTTKEIAQLLNISSRGVEVSRHRLRKKLHLKQDDNLVEFLMSEEYSLSE